MTLRDRPLLLALLGLLGTAGCAHAQSGGAAPSSRTVSAPGGSCSDPDRLPEVYFGRQPQEQFGYVKANSATLGYHALHLCRAGEAPLLSVGQSPFIRCVWYRAFEGRIVMSLGSSCTLASRRYSDEGGQGRIHEYTRPLPKSECSNFLTAALAAARTGAGRRTLPPDMSQVDGDALYFEYRDGAVYRAGYVDAPVMDEGATGAVKACLMLRDSLQPKAVQPAH
ncbi:MAG TPA: hypothetical protein VE153_26430 [Myxococcus sp.]|nr:hypothetical protein [Myxococcus sp.]